MKAHSKMRQVMPSTLLLALVAVALASGPLSGSEVTGDNGSRLFLEYEALSIPLGQRQLFIDDYLLGDVDRVERIIHQPKRYEGNPILKADLPSDGSMIQLRDAPVWDEKDQIWKLWYFRFANDGNAGGGSGFATSKDGVVWDKPVLGLNEVDGNRNNNVVAIEGMPNGFTQHVVIDPSPSVPADRRYKGMIGWSDRRPMVSADGLTFKPLPVPPIPSQDESHLNWDSLQQQWILTLKLRGPFGRAIHLSTSKDFEHWTKPILIYHADFLDQKLGAKHIESVQANPRYWRPTINNPREYKTEIYNMPVFVYESLYLGLPTYFESSGRIPPPFGNQDGTNSVKLVASRDLRAWTRVGDRTHFFEIAEMGDGVLDTGQVAMASHPILRGDELWFYYLGVDVRYRPGKVENRREWYKGGIHLAKLRRDGFVSLRAGEELGIVETRALRLEGNHLYVNAVTERGGEITVEMLTSDGMKVQDGWGKARCLPIVGDQLKAEVKWEGRTLSELNGQNLRLRFNLTNAEIYSFWTE